jgi:hypothetical protein
VQIRGLKFGLRAALVVLALGATGAAAATGVTLPSQANQHAKDHVNSQSTPSASPSPNAHAAFGQCVAANAKTASDHKADHANGSSGWNPTDGCTKPNGGSNDEGSNDSSTGLDNATTHANSHASDGLSHAAAGADNGNNP